MQIFNAILVVLVVLGVTIYSYNFGRWIWGQQNRIGAIGVWSITLLAFALPIWVYFFRPRF
jgi:hypothetical protein